MKIQLEFDLILKSLNLNRVNKKVGLTISVFRISLTMLIFLLLSASFGLEGGYSVPALGYNGIKSGAELEIYVSQPLSIMDFSFAVGASFYSGENPAYTMSFYQAKTAIYKRNWRFSPYLDIGIDYVTRDLRGEREIGFCGNYTLGFLVNFYHERIRLYPKFYYTGVTDFVSHGGFIGAKMGLAYDL